MNKISTVGVIGAGVMGRGIAAANLEHGVSVILADSHKDNLQAAVADLNHSRPGIRRATTTAASSNDDMTDAQVVIEAVTEKLSVKQQVLVGVEQHVSASAILASNTSSILISRIAERLVRPERFCGLHFCHPVRRRPLVEVVRGAQTSQATIDDATSYVRQIGKSPIVVGDCPGFVVNRLLSPYLNESLELILEGADPAMVEACARAFGMPLGPLRQFDEYGIDIAVRTGAMLQSAYPDRFIASDLPVALYGIGRLGRKNGAGFYSYIVPTTKVADDVFNLPETGSLDADVSRIIEECRKGSRSFSPAEITMRLFLPMLLEATRILEERVVPDAASVDEALANGLGFLPLEGGLLRWADTTRLKRILTALKPFESLGKRYEPTMTLIDLAKKSRGIYDAFAVPLSRAA